MFGYFQFQRNSPDIYPLLCPKIFVCKIDCIPFLWKLAVNFCHCVLFLCKLSVNSYSSGTLPISPVVSVETLPVSPVVGSDVSAAPLPSPVMSVSNRSEDAHNQTQSSSKKNVQLLPAKREATALSGVSPGVLRRSPRLEAS